MSQTIPVGTRVIQQQAMWNVITLTSQWPRWRLKSPASRLFTQSFIQAQIKENIKAPRHWPLCGEFTGTGEFPARRASNAENVSIWWRHHVLVVQYLQPQESNFFRKKFNALWAQVIYSVSIQWCHNERDGVSNHQGLDGLLNCFFRRRSKKHQSSASLAFVRGIHQWRVNSPHKGQ